MKHGKLFIVSAPSGAGKTSVVNETLRRLKSEGVNIERVVTYTSRPPRQGEKDGKDYNFVSKDEFANKADSGFFLEFTSYNDKPYGTPGSILQDMELGKSFVAVVDIEGAKALSNLVKNAVTIWINTSSIEELKRRLEKRSDTTHEQILKRLEIAKKEIEAAKSSGQSRRIFGYQITNDVFENAVCELEKIITEELEKASSAFLHN